HRCAAVLDAAEDRGACQAREEKSEDAPLHDQSLPVFRRGLCRRARTAPPGSRAFWNSTIHPGYSMGSALASSSALTCSADSRSPAAAMLSTSWSFRLAPMMMLVTNGLVSC